MNFLILALEITNFESTTLNITNFFFGPLKFTLSRVDYNVLSFIIGPGIIKNTKLVEFKILNVVP